MRRRLIKNKAHKGNKMLTNNLTKKSVELDTAKLGKHMFKLIPVVVIVALAWSALYTIDEGHVGIVKRFGEATVQVNPGLHYKIPFVNNYLLQVQVSTRLFFRLFFVSRSILYDFKNSISRHKLAF